MSLGQDARKTVACNVGTTTGDMNSRRARRSPETLEDEMSNPLADFQEWSNEIHAERAAQAQSTGASDTHCAGERPPAEE